VVPKGRRPFQNCGTAFGLFCHLTPALPIEGRELRLSLRDGDQGYWIGATWVAPPGEGEGDGEGDGDGDGDGVAVASGEACGMVPAPLLGMATPVGLVGATGAPVRAVLVSGWAPGGPTGGVSGWGSKQPDARSTRAAPSQRTNELRMGDSSRPAWGGAIAKRPNSFSIYPFPLDKGVLFA
jgi:hypothetical protein